MNNIQVAENFHLREFQCKDGSHQVVLHSELLRRLQDLRSALGRPILVHSGYRNPAHNAQVGGSPGSYHLRGMAADISAPGLHPPQLALERLFGPAGREKRFARCRFHNWETRPGTEQAFQAARRYARDLPRHIEAGRGLLLFGPPGSGKSHLAAAVSAAALERGYTALFQRVPALLSRLRSAYDPRAQATETQLIGALTRADLLVLDDAGAEKATPWTEQTLYTVIDERYSRQRPLILTTNAGLDTLEQKVGSRAMDRLLEICQIVENRGQSYRREQAVACLGQHFGP